LDLIVVQIGNDMGLRDSAQQHSQATATRQLLARPILTVVAKITDYFAGNQG
jgi:hypothetical protein